MNARKRRMKGKKRHYKSSDEYIIIKIPKDNPESTIKYLSKKYDCSCRCK